MQEKRVVQYRFEDGNFTALFVDRGRKTLSLVPMTAFGSTGMKVVKLPISEERNLREVEYKGKPYNYGRALAKFKAAYRKFGGTKAVKRALYS